MQSRLQDGFLRMHQAVYERTGGRIGHRLVGVPTLLLRTTGRRTGKVRTSALTYVRDGADYVLVASNAGLPRPPGWLLNITASPEVELQVARRRAAGRARVVEAANPDYPCLWRLANENNHHRYEGYQARTDRPISIVLVTPTEPLAA